MLNRGHTSSGLTVPKSYADLVILSDKSILHTCSEEDRQIVRAKSLQIHLGHLAFLSKVTYTLDKKKQKKKQYIF